MSELADKTNDLSDRFCAMTVKELRQGMRRGMFTYPFIFIQLLSVLAMIMEFQVGDAETYSGMTGVLNPGLFFTSGVFWMVAGGVCIVVMPLGGLGLMGEELDSGNHELLLMTPLSRWKVVRGKFLALWGLCLITFVSLLPYLIVRYFIGGIDPWRNIVMSLSVVAGSALMCAGAIGVSVFKSYLQRGLVFGLFMLSMILSWLAPMLLSYGLSGGCGVFYHLTALSFLLCYTVMGLAMARSGIRLVVNHYEVKPGFLLIGALFFAPVVITIFTFMTMGFGGFLALLGVAFLVWFMDTTPKAPSWVTVPVSNAPPMPTDESASAKPVSVDPS